MTRALRIALGIVVAALAGAAAALLVLGLLWLLGVVHDIGPLVCAVGCITSAISAHFVMEWWLDRQGAE